MDTTFKRSHSSSDLNILATVHDPYPDLHENLDSRVFEGITNPILDGMVVYGIMRLIQVQPAHWPLEKSFLEYKVVQDLLKKHPELRQFFQEQWAARSLRNVRLLSVYLDNDYRVL